MLDAAQRGEEQRAPVEHRSFRQKHDKAQDADEHHPAARQDEHRPAVVGAALTQQMAAGECQQHYHRQYGKQGGLQRRQAQPQQRADATGAGNAADAEETVKTRHHRLAAGAFDDHRLNVHRHVDHADRRPKQQQRHGHAAEGIHQRQQRQIDT